METSLKIRKIKVSDLRPTQMTAGFREIKAKRREWKDADGSQSERRKFIDDHVIPAVIGPDKDIYVTDHHHIARSFLDEDVKHALVVIHCDLSDLPRMTFWNFMDQKSWCRPVDDNGRRQDFDQIPDDLAGLKDDPYRSLSAAVERAGGYAKDGQPFNEFLWADYFRSHIRRKSLEKDFDAAVDRAIEAARTNDARYLPGWCGGSQ